MDAFVMGFSMEGLLPASVIAGAVAFGVSGIVAIVGAPFVQLATRMVAGFTPRYGRAWWAYALGFLPGLLILMYLKRGEPTYQVQLEEQLVLSLLSLLAQSLIFMWAIRDGADAAIGFGRALLVSITQAVLTIVAFAILGAILLTTSPSLMRQKPKLLGAPSPSTPHPASDSRQLAIRIYPELLDPGSELNRRFLTLHAEAEMFNPALLRKPDWPMILAGQAAKYCGEAPRHLDR